MILGFHEDPALGPSMLIGAGGKLTELYEDIALCVLPASEADIRCAISSLKMFPLLNGYRGDAPVNVDALVEICARFAHMCKLIGSNLLEAEINPLLIRSDRGIFAADGVLVTNY